MSSLMKDTADAVRQLEGRLDVVIGPGPGDGPSLLEDVRDRQRHIEARQLEMMEDIQDLRATQDELVTGIQFIQNMLLNP